MTVVKSLTGHEAAVTQVESMVHGPCMCLTSLSQQLAFNAGGHLAMSASRDGSVRFWDMLSGLNVKTLSDAAMIGQLHPLPPSWDSTQPCSSGDLTSAALSGQGTLLLTMSKHGPIRLWDLRRLDRPLQRSPHTRST